MYINMKKNNLEKYLMAIEHVEEDSIVEVQLSRDTNVQGVSAECVSWVASCRDASVQRAVDGVRLQRDVDAWAARVGFSSVVDRVGVFPA